MKSKLSLLSFLLILSACQENSDRSANKEAQLDAPQKPQSTTECDSLKFPDFKRNIQELELKITPDFKNEIDKIANDFIKKRCEQDSLFCDEIYLKDQNHYRSSFGYDLFSFAYAYTNSETGMEKESASFFVFGIKQKGQTIFYDIVDDLIGEIQLQLTGLEIEGDKMILWGEMYPYFSSDDYGKFKLTVVGQEKSYEFQCKSGPVAMTNISYNDTITFDRSEFPVDSFSNKVLTVGTFHEDEVWKSAENENWFGVFKGTNGCYISQTKIKTIKVFDPILDEDSLKAKTGWEVVAINRDTCIILIAGLDFLSSRRINQAVLSKDQIFPGDTLRINYLGIEYKIFATGSKKKVQDDPEWFDVWDYNLYLTATIKGQQQNSLLVSVATFNDQMISLLFAGDIDGDGILDLIIDTSRNYNVTSPTIYLSRPAENGEVVKPIGGHTSVGC